MCLSLLNARKTTVLQNKLKANAGVICWKVLRKDNDKLESPYMYTKYVKGENKSDRKSAKLTSEEKRNNRINNGIHVYLSKEDAKLSENVGDDSVYPVFCLLKDLVSVGRFINVDSAVFTKVNLL